MMPEQAELFPAKDYTDRYFGTTDRSTRRKAHRHRKAIDTTKVTIAL